VINNAGAVAPIAGRFRPESGAYFKEVAKNMAWLLDRPLQKCQEDLARIYGYSGLHELQEVLKRPGISGPFAPRYGYHGSDAEAIIETQERRIFLVLFGTFSSYWREDHLARDQCFLVFEMGLFQEAAEHRACVEKIKHVRTYGNLLNDWPLVHGWPLGLKSWLAAGYTEPEDLAEDWHEVLPLARYAHRGCADIRWQRRMAGLVRLATLFKVLAPRVSGRKPNGMGKVAFRELEDDAGGVTDTSWEGSYLADWLEQKLVDKVGEATIQQREAIEAFVRRPSRSTAASCEFVKGLKDPVGFRDRWAFESFKAALDRYSDGSKAQFASSLDNGAIQSLYLHMDADSAEISEGGGCQLWQFHYTRTEVTGAGKVGRGAALQPTIHANGSLIKPFDENLVFLHPSDWYVAHDDSEFATEAGAAAFDRLYLPAIGVKQLDFSFRNCDYSIVEIDELLVVAGVSAEALKSYFVRLLDLFDDDYLPDSYGYWCKTLDLDYDDEEENSRRHEDSAYADYVCVPSVLLINVAGCGLTFVHATHMNGKPVSTIKRGVGKEPDASAEALAGMLMEAVRELAVDVVVYDGDAWD
jgi:hypothetical protein